MTCIRASTIQNHTISIMSLIPTGKIQYYWITYNLLMSWFITKKKEKTNSLQKLECWPKGEYFLANQSRCRFLEPPPSHYLSFKQNSRIKHFKGQSLFPYQQLLFALALFGFFKTCHVIGSMGRVSRGPPLCPITTMGVKVVT